MLSRVNHRNTKRRVWTRSDSTSFARASVSWKTAAWRIRAFIDWWASRPRSTSCCPWAWTGGKWTN